MFHRILCAAAVLLGACNGSSNDPKPKADLTYSLTPVFTEDENLLQVKAEFMGDADGETKIRVGGRWKRDPKAGERFRDLKLSGAGAAFLEADHQPIRSIKHAPGAPLTITYNLTSRDMEDASSNIEYFYAPVLLPDVIHLLGSTSLIVPVTDDPNPESETAKLDVDIIWTNLPEGWTSMDTLPDRPISPQLIGSQILAAAPGHQVSVTHGDYELTVLKAGRHDFNVAEFNDRIAAIYEGLNKLWRADELKYLVTLLGAPDNASYTSFTGTGRYNSFASAATQGIDLDFLTQFLAHEVTHHWVPNALGQWSDCPEPDNCPPQIKWFSEGFTDFVMTRAMRAEGRWTRADLLAFTNQYLQDYYLSSARRATGAAIDANFWTDFEHERQPYWRGFLLAMNWNSEIEQASSGESSVMNVLQDMYETAKTAQTENYPVLTPEYIARNFSAKAGRDVYPDVEQFYHQGELIKPNPNMFSDCARLISADFYSYDVGFDAQTTLSSGIVSGVMDGHNAAKAGLKDGQILIAKLSGGGGDTTIPLALEVKDKDSETPRKIAYMPVSGAPVTLPQFEQIGDCPD